MTNEQLNTALYEKVFAEQDVFRSWLLSQKPEVILQHSYEYTVREDIVLSLEYNDLSDAQAKALFDSPSPLADVYKDWQKKETDYMENIWQTVEERAGKEMQKSARKQDSVLGKLAQNKEVVASAPKVGRSAAKTHEESL